MHSDPKPEGQKTANSIITQTQSSSAEGLGVHGLVDCTKTVRRIQQAHKLGLDIPMSIIARVQDFLSSALTDSDSSSVDDLMFGFPVSVRSCFARDERILAPRVSLRKMTSTMTAK